MKDRHKVTLAAVGTVVSVLLGGLEIAREIRVVFKEHADHVRAENEYDADISARVCALEKGRMWKGDCIRGHR